MKIFYIGWLSHPHPYISSLKNSFERIGHQVFGFESRPDAGKNNDEINKELILECKKFSPDIIFVSKSNNVFFETLEAIKKQTNAVLVLHQYDDPFFYWLTKKYVSESLEKYRLCDFIFIYDSYFIPRLKHFGIENSFFLPNATDPKFFHKISDFNEYDFKKYGSDVSFVGVPTEDRIKFLGRISENFHLKVWGRNNPSCDGLQWPEGFNTDFGDSKQVSINELNKIMNYSKILINYHHEQAVFGINIRTFDVPAAGGFLLCDYHEDIEKCFDIPSEIVTYEGVKDAIKKIEFYLDHEPERIQISNNAHNRVQKEHTFDHRAKTIIQTIKKYAN